MTELSNQFLFFQLLEAKVSSSPLSVLLKMTNELIHKTKLEIIPEIKLQCPNCKVDFNIEAIHRIYRAYLVLTRNSRKTSYSVVCSKCGKHTQVRVPPLHPNEYQCRQCQFRAEVDGKIGYKKNPLANKRIE